MLQIGKIQELTLARITSVGGYLTDGRDDVLLPNKYLPRGADLGESLKVFVYLDSEDRPVATTIFPKAEIDTFAALRCVAVNQVGAFLDWGLEKDLLVPFREQLNPMREDQVYVVRVLLDPASNRPVASAKLRKFLVPVGTDVRAGQKVTFLISELKPHAVSGIADGRYSAVVLEDEETRPVRVGQTVDAYVKSSNEESLLLALRPIGRAAELSEAEQLLSRIKREGGFLGLHDRSDPDQIQRQLGVSKSTFKRMVGHLLKEGKIETDPYGIRLKPDS